MAEPAPEPGNPQSVRPRPGRGVRVRSLVIIFCIVLAFAGLDRSETSNHRFLQSQGEPRSGESVSELHLLTWNIHRAEGTDGVTDLGRIAEHLERSDLAGLYEVGATLASKQIFDLARLTGRQGWWIPTERRWFHDHFGNGLLTAVPLDGVLPIPLPCTQGKKFRRAVLMNTQLSGTRVSILAVHLDRDQDRLDQLSKVVRLFTNLRSPAVLMGDLNTPRTDPLLRRLLEREDTADVLESRQVSVPADRIDWLIVRGLDVTSAAMVDSGASDHPLIEATVRLVGSEPAVNPD